MCCLFGMIDLEQKFSAREKSHMMSVLATACEARGTDATGIAYNSCGKLRIYKRLIPAHKMRFKIQKDAQVIMGHTRLATKGSAKFSKNNHPFSGKAGHQQFALAHNGMLYNDTHLRRSERLPATTIETDSYVAVQLIEQKKTLTFDSLRGMAEKVEGSFTFTVLSDQNDLYFVKGDNPLCLYFYPEQKLYLYASTEEILSAALEMMHISLGTHQKIVLDCGDILCITQDGTRAKTKFSATNRFGRWYWLSVWDNVSSNAKSRNYSTVSAPDPFYLQELKAVAGVYGYTPEAIDILLEDGYTTEEIEELLYCGSFC